MTPKEKAEELILKFELVKREFSYLDEINLFEAKQCALICVAEMTGAINSLERKYKFDYTESYEFWNEVEKEIKQL